MGISVICLGAIVLALSGVPGLFLRKGSQPLATGAMLVGAALGLTGWIASLAGADGGTLRLPWSMPWGRFAVAVDGISLIFLFPVFLIPALGSIYGMGYWRDAEHPTTGRKLRFFYGLLAAAMVLVVIARDSVLFMMAWEVMALAAYFLVTTEDDDAAACRAGWHYLVATHIGSLCLMAMFALLAHVSGTSAIESIQGGRLGPGMAITLFALAVVGFGLKAGIMPLHVWLPGAHANAPSHVSAVMSGVMIKIGIYGIVRMSGLLPPLPAGVAGTVLALGAISGLLGITLANAERDLKRVLAYCSIENIGIITMGLGLAMLGRAYGRTDWVVLGLAGALLHVWNHALFKSLLFFGAGSVIHAMHTREIDRMGGLAKRMPRSAWLFLLGSVAICGLPPLNGFISELLIYVGLFRTLVGPGRLCTGAAFVAPVLATMGGLAVACFVRVFGVIFLGEPRTAAAQNAHEAPVSMLRSAAVPAALCGAIGLLPIAVVPALNRAVASWMGASVNCPAVQSMLPLNWISVMCIALAVMVLAATLKLWRQMQSGAFGTVGTWDCGYVAPNARMQYTAGSFAQMLVRLFASILRPQQSLRGVKELFPQSGDFEIRVEDPVFERGVLPTMGAAERVATRLRFLQQGSIQMYILYILVIAVVLLLAAVRN